MVDLGVINKLLWDPQLMQDAFSANWEILAHMDLVAPILREIDPLFAMAISNMLSSRHGKLSATIYHMGPVVALYNDRIKIEMSEASLDLYYRWREDKMPDVIIEPYLWCMGDSVPPYLHVRQYTEDKVWLTFLHSILLDLSEQRIPKYSRNLVKYCIL